MRKLSCDVCKRELVNPVSGLTYWHFCQYDVCEACKDSIEAKLKPVIRSHVPFSNDWYQSEFMAMVEKSVGSKR